MTGRARRAAGQRAVAGTRASEPGRTFVVSSMVALVTAEPYLRAALTRGGAVWLVCPDEVARKAGAAIDGLAGRTNPPLRRSRLDPLLRAVHTGLLVLLAARPFKSDVPAHRDPRRAGGGRTSRALLAVSAVTARLRPRRVNRLLRALLRPLRPNPFPTTDVVAVSYASSPHLLCARGQRVTTLMESWDHPVKKAVGYHSDVVVAWNRDLATDWLRHQGAGRAVVGYPVKLRYAAEHDLGSPPPIDGASGTALYAAGTSSNTDRPGWFAEELEVIAELVAATAEAGWRLLIKPKPNGRRGDFDQFSEAHPHVAVGTYQDTPGAVDYYLDDDYNKARMGELERAHVVVNCWTTFALDAALAGRPVLQLDLRAHGRRWPAMAQAMRNHHLSAYLLGDQPGVLRPDPSAPLRDTLRDALADPFGPAERFRDHLRAWLLPTESAEAAVDRVLDGLAGDGRG